MKKTPLFILFFSFSITLIFAQESIKKIRVIAFYTAVIEPPHCSFVHAANKWFTEKAEKNNFTYDSTNDWNNMNTQFLSNYEVVLFLDTRPENPNQRLAFQKYMESGGGWMGFHFSGFALTPSAYNQDWNWYHNYFIGAGQYKSNTWRPTSALLRVEEKKHPTTLNLSVTFTSAPNEWYRWENDIRKNKKIKILLAIDSKSFPLGTGPKPQEIWHSGYYPVAWTNTEYKMIYINMGHDDFDFENQQPLSSTFGGKEQNQFILNCLLWLGSAKEKQ